MAFNSKDLSVLVYANGFTLWHYRTIDLATDVDMPGYFDGAVNIVNVGDMIIANIDIDDTPTSGIFLINASGGGVVSVADMTAIGSSKVDQP